MSCARAQRCWGGVRDSVTRTVSADVGGLEAERDADYSTRVPFARLAPTPLPPPPPHALAELASPGQGRTMALLAGGLGAGLGRGAHRRRRRQARQHGLARFSVGGHKVIGGLSERVEIGMFCSKHDMNTQQSRGSSLGDTLLARVGGPTESALTVGAQIRSCGRTGVDAECGLHSRRRPMIDHTGGRHTEVVLAGHRVANLEPAFV